MKFTPNPRGIEEALRSGEMADFLTKTAEAVADEIRRNAPRSEWMDYAEGIDVEPARAGFDGTLEAAAIVDAPSWHLLEYGSVNTAPRAIMRRAARSVGLDFRET